MAIRMCVFKYSTTQEDYINMNQIFQTLIGRGPQVVQRQEVQQRGPSFFQELRVYPSYFCEREDIDKGDKILLPASALNSLYHLISGRNKNPMIFCLQNPLLSKQTYCGVLEFVAEEGNCYIPKWMFKMLKFTDAGSPCTVCLVPDLKRNKGTNFVKLQPHQTKFIELPNPKAILEIQLRNFTCLHVGDTITIQTFDGTYQIDILEIKPKNEYDALCVIDADVEVDFAPPLDYEEPTLPIKKQHSNVTFEGGKTEGEQGKTAFFGGQGVRIDQKASNPGSRKPSQQVDIVDEYDPRKHRIVRGVRKATNDFKGTSTRLGGQIAGLQKKPI